MDKKHILITYTNTGSGHKTPAEAVASSIEELYPGKYQITISDFFLDAGEVFFNDAICKGWNWLLARPKVNFFNILLSKMFFPVTYLFLPFFAYWSWKQSMRYIKNINPDIIFTTHFYCQNVAVDAKKKYRLAYPIITLNPDTFETFPQWDRRGGLFLVHSEIARERALFLRHKAKNIRIVPQALRKSFDDQKKFDKAALKKKYGLDPQYFTLFMSDGGQGIGRMEACFEALLASNIALNIICICGRNEKLYKKLMLLKEKKSHPKIKILVFSYTENMAELLAAADLFSGKGGPASVIEALKMKIPVVVTYEVNTAEVNTRRFFCKQGMAWKSKKPKELPALVESFQNNPELLQNAKKAIEASDFFANGSPVIAKMIVNLLETGKSE